MAGTGNLLLKRGTAEPSAGSTPTLLKSMPAAQIQGLSEATTAGLAKYNYENRLWLGCNTYGSNTSTGGVGSSGQGADREVTAISLSGNPSDYNGPKRPIWIGAEIRAFTPLKVSGDSTYYTILKADWDSPSDYVLVTQKAIASYVSTQVGIPKLYEVGDTTLTGNTVKLRVSSVGWSGSALGTDSYIAFPDPAGDVDSNTPSAGSVMIVGTIGGSGFNKQVIMNWASPSTFVSDSNPSAKFALLGEDGALKGPQTFQSKLVVEQELEVNGYTSESITYGAKITSQAQDAYLFNENVLDLSIGGGASVISIGNPSSDSCTVTVYDELIVTGNLEANSIDGGNF
jgi:hypothetical protein